jgi:hypothetical protein
MDQQTETDTANANAAKMAAEAKTALEKMAKEHEAQAVEERAQAAKLQQEQRDASNARLAAMQEKEAELRLAAMTPEQRAAHEEANKSPPAEEIERQKKIAEFNAHPHTLLQAIQKDMQAPALDVNARLGMLQGSLARLIQVVLSHTPPPKQEKQ